MSQALTLAGLQHALGLLSQFWLSCSNNVLESSECNRHHPVFKHDFCPETIPKCRFPAAVSLLVHLPA